MRKVIVKYSAHWAGWAVCLLLLPWGAQGQEGEFYEDELPNINPVQMELMRQTPGTFRPGTMLDITLTILVNQSNPDLTALGLRETLPQGWSFSAMRGVTGQPPAVMPQPGATGMLEFAWITPPNQFPYTITYTVQIPPESGGKQFISGQLVYRQFAGELLTAPIITALQGPDNQPPVVTLQGDNPLVLERGTPYVEPGYTASDNTDGDVTASVQVSGSVNHQATGTYTLTYTATDRAGNRSTPVTRQVQVVNTTSQTPVAGTPSSGPRTGLPRPRGGSVVPRTAAQGGERQQRETEPGPPQQQNVLNGERITPTDDALQRHLQQARDLQRQQGGPQSNNVPSIRTNPNVIYPQRSTDGDESGPVSAVARRVAQNLESAPDAGSTAESDASDTASPTPPAPRQEAAQQARRDEGTRDLAESAPVALDDSESDDTVLAATASKPTPGALERLRMSLAAMGTGGLIRLGGMLAAALVVFGLAYLAYASAYRKAPRRRITNRESNADTPAGAPEPQARS